MSTVALAANWQQIAAGDKVQVFLDVNSVTTIKGNLRKAWTMWDWSEPQDAKYAYPKKFSSAKQLDVFNCAERTSATLQIIQMEGIHGVGEVIFSHSNAIEKVSFADVVPETLGEATLDVVCARARGTK